MSNISVQRALQTTTQEFVGELEAGFVLESGDRIFLPLLIDNFSGPDISVTGINLTATESTISGSAGKFDNIRPGDILSAVTTGSITANDPVALNNIYTASGLKFVVYPESYTSVNLGVHAGDAITGTGIPASTFVERIDYDTRRIYITNACTATAIQTDVEVTPPVRVVAVRKSTATSNPNQIDIDSVVGTNGTNSTLTFVNGARDAVFAVLRITPVDSTTSATARFNVDVAYVAGDAVMGSPAGFNGLNFTSLTYTGLGVFNFNLDTFLATARIPQPTGV